MDLYKNTLTALKERPRNCTFLTIEKDTGIKESWLKKFISESIKNPGIKTVQKLYNYLITL